jgi:hypothetical protein
MPEVSILSSRYLMATTATTEDSALTDFQVEEIQVVKLSNLTGLGLDLLLEADHSVHLSYHHKTYFLCLVYLVLTLHNLLNPDLPTSQRKCFVRKKVIVPKV